MSSAPTEAHLAAARALWGLEGELTFLRKVENWIYATRDANRELILRVSDPVRRSRGQLAAELAWIAFLAERGVGVAAPVRSASGEHVEVLEVDGVAFHAVVFLRAAGRQPGNADLAAPLFTRWGHTLGRMHAMTAGYSPPAGIEPRPAWDQESGFLEASGELERPGGVEVEVYREALAWMQQLPRDATRYGLVHADLHHGNFFLTDGGELICFDFDDSHRNWFAYDAAVPFLNVLYDRAQEGLEFSWSTLWEAFSSGYASAGPPRELELADVVRFLRYRAASLHLWCSARLARGELSERVRDYQRWLVECLSDAAWPLESAQEAP